MRTNDQAAWEQLVSHYYRYVYGWCRRSGLCPDDAADVCQEVFRSVVGSLGNFHRDRDHDTFRGWLRRITQRRVCDHRQKRRDQPQAEGGSDAQARLMELATDRSSASSRSIWSSRLGQALEVVRCEFESTTWQAFWRATVDQEPAADVAAAPGLTANAVYVAKSRVLRRLRQEMDRRNDGRDES
ncbi:MAG: RNA polymerase sigma factor [Gemmataceae bacterium]|nr:RNA polymerase sigma factor [Gemmataceae bacterium]